MDIQPRAPFAQPPAQLQPDPVVPAELHPDSVLPAQPIPENMENRLPPNLRRSTRIRRPPDFYTPK